MNRTTFSKKDIDQITKTGLDLDTIYSQLSLFQRGTPFVNLDRPCTVGDGIKKLSIDIIKRCIHLYETQGIKKHLIKFVPASGAATRMFKKQINAYHAMQYNEQNPESINSQVSEDLSFFFE